MSGQLSESEENQLRLRMKPLICGSLNGMRLRQSFHSHAYPERDVDPLEGTAARSWILGIVEQSLGEGCC